MLLFNIEYLISTRFAFRMSFDIFRSKKYSCFFDSFCLEYLVVILTCIKQPRESCLKEISDENKIINENKKWDYLE